MPPSVSWRKCSALKALTKFAAFYQNLKSPKNTQTFVYSEYMIATEATDITLFFGFLSKFLDTLENSSVTDGQEYFS